jgi:hypothetical protein
MRLTGASNIPLSEPTSKRRQRAIIICIIIPNSSMSGTSNSYLLLDALLGCSSFPSIGCPGFCHTTTLLVPGTQPFISLLH